MKKLFSVILTFALVSSLMPVYANQAEKMQNVLLSVKERIMDTEEFEEFNSSLMESGEEKSYSFDWYSNADESYKSLSVTADDSGIITNYRYYNDSNSNNRTPSINKMSSDEALIKAQKLVDKLNPMIADEIRVEKTDNVESLFDNTYRFNLQRYVNDIPVYNNSGFVTVNQDATQITRYSLNYTEGLTFEALDNIIDVTDAWDYYYKNAGAELEYRLRYKDKDKEKEVYLAYIPQLGSEEYIDAKSGEVTPIWHKDYYYFSDSEIYATGMNKDMAVEESARLSEIELKKIEEVAGLMSAQDAQDAIKNNDILDFEEDLILTSMNLYKDYLGERYFYDITYESHMNDVYKYVSVTLDARTLEIIRWRARTDDYIKYHNNETRIDRADVETKALTALKILAPKYFLDDSEYKLLENSDSTNSVSYTRYVNDIKFNNDYVNIEINPENGKVWNFSINYTDVKFPLPDGIITEEHSILKMSEQTEMKLYYFPSSEGLKADTALLGYKNEYVSEIDAISGEIENNQEESKKLTYTDISNHYAKEEIETLAKFGIGFEGSELRPGDVITVNEYITLLISTFSNYTPIILKASNDVTYEFKEAHRSGIINLDEINPDEPLTREMTAIYMIRVMGLEEVAKLPIYKSLFSDVNENVGYVSILGAMGVFKGDENSLFNPANNLTRADALILIYNYLSR